ncbi:uncharacterized protein [Periplaneta americana]|uniref:uncharacterized protein isoform X2 n=1 Tax=Periplaneta americana TaxID=6978 RepID=UPI0037E966DA
MEQRSVLPAVFEVVLLALLLVTPTLAAPPLQTYTLMSDHATHEQLKDGSSITEHTEDSLHVPATYNADMWASAPDIHHSSTEEAGISSAMVWPSDTTLSTISSTGFSSTVGDHIEAKAVTDPNSSTYLPSGAEPIGLAGEVTPFVLSRSSSQDSASESETHMFLYPTVTEEHVSPPVSSVDSLQFETPVLGKHSVASDDENVPVKILTSAPETETDSKNISGAEGTTVSIKVVPKSFAADDNRTVVNSSTDVTDAEHSSFNSSESVSPFTNSSSSISLDPMAEILHSHSQGVDKPFADTPRLITRDLKNSSEASHNTSSQISVSASRENTSQPESTSQNTRAGKAASFFPAQPVILHHTTSSTISPSRDGPESFPFPQSSDTSDITHDLMQGYIPGPKSSEEFLNPRYTDSAIKDSSISELEDDERRIIPLAEGSRSVGGGPLEDVEMGDGPYSPPESSTNRDSKLSPISKLPPIPSSDLVLPTEKSDGDGKPSNTDHPSPGTRDKGRDKVIPPLTISSRFGNATLQSGRQSQNATRNSHVPSSVPENSDSSTSVGTATEHADPSTVVSNPGSLPADTKNGLLTTSSKVSGVKHVVNATPTANSSAEDGETTVVTVLPTVVPISNGRVAAAAAPPSQPHHGLDAASITGISLGILVFAALVGAVSFVLYRRRFLNKPQTLNDKCSNPDSSGYIDDSTLRENSEEMYSLDNDSFLNSLEAMTIQNYWTDNVKHTKL